MNGAIRDGAQMLNYLAPVADRADAGAGGQADPGGPARRAAARASMEAGARFQKPTCGSRRADPRWKARSCEVCADAPEAGHGLHEPDRQRPQVQRRRGARRLARRTGTPCWWACWTRARPGGASLRRRRPNCSQPFGRLDTHAAVEGTGLGLVSARKIVEAHGGEVFVEGHADGTPAAPSFTTAQAPLPLTAGRGFPHRLRRRLPGARQQRLRLTTEDKHR